MRKMGRPHGRSDREHEQQLLLYLHQHQRHDSLSLRADGVSASCERIAGALAANGLANPLFGSAQGSAALQSIISADDANLFAREYAVIVRRSLAAQAALAAAMAPAGVGGVPNPPQFLDPATGKLTDNNLASSLQTVARVIAGRSALGVSRQIFFVELNGFDTHDTQAKRLSTLLSQLAAAFEYFDQLMTTSGLSSRLGEPSYRRRGRRRTEYLRPVPRDRRRPGQ